MTKILYLGTHGTDDPTRASMPIPSPSVSAAIIMFNVSPRFSGHTALSGMTSFS